MREEANKAIQSKAWPFIEAEKIYNRIGGKTPKKGQTDKNPYD